MSVSGINESFNRLQNEIIPALEKARTHEAVDEAQNNDLCEIRKTLKALRAAREYIEGSALVAARATLSASSPEEIIRAFQGLKLITEDLEQAKAQLTKARDQAKEVERERIPANKQVLYQGNTTGVEIRESSFDATMLQMRASFFWMCIDAEDALRVANRQLSAQQAPIATPPAQLLDKAIVPIAHVEAAKTAPVSAASPAQLPKAAVVSRHLLPPLTVKPGHFPPVAFFKGASTASKPQAAPRAAPSAFVVVTAAGSAGASAAPAKAICEITDLVSGLSLNTASPLQPSRKVETRALTPQAASAPASSPDETPGASGAVSPLPSSSPLTNGTFAFAAGSAGAKKPRSHRRAASAHMANAAKIFDAWERLNTPGYFPRFDDLVNLINIAENYKLKGTECNHLVKFRNKLPQASGERWKEFALEMRLTKKAIAEGLPEGTPATIADLIASYAGAGAMPLTMEGVSGTQYTFHETEDPLAVHFTRVEFAGMILTAMTEANGDQAALLANPKYIMNTTPKLCVSMMQSGKTCSYYSSQPQKWPGIGLKTAIMSAESVVHAHTKDSYSPTYFHVPGAQVTAATEKDSADKVDFFNNFWLRFSVIRSYVDTICQNVAFVYNPDPIRRQLMLLRDELQEIGVSQNAVQALQNIMTTDYTVEQVQDAIKLAFQLNQQAVVVAPPGINSEVVQKAQAAAQMKSEQKRVALIKKIFPAVQADTLDAAIQAVNALLAAEIQAKREASPPPAVNRSELLINLDEAITNVSVMKLEKGSALDRLIFKRVFKHEPKEGQNTLEELEKIGAFLGKLCAENFPKLRKANDANPDLTIFGKLLTPEELIDRTAPNTYNEVNLLTATAKAVGLEVPHFNGVVLEEYMLEDGKVPANVEPVLQQAVALQMPLYILRAQKK